MLPGLCAGSEPKIGRCTCLESLLPVQSRGYTHDKPDGLRGCWFSYCCAADLTAEQESEIRTAACGSRFGVPASFYWTVPGTRRYLDERQAKATLGFRCAMDRVGSPVGLGLN